MSIQSRAEAARCNGGRYTSLQTRRPAAAAAAAAEEREEEEEEEAASTTMTVMVTGTATMRTFSTTGSDSV